MALMDLTLTTFTGNIFVGKSPYGTNGFRGCISDFNFNEIRTLDVAMGRFLLLNDWLIVAFIQKFQSLSSKFLFLLTRSKIFLSCYININENENYNISKEVEVCIIEIPFS